MTKDIPVAKWFVSTPASSVRYSPANNYNKGGYQPTYSNTSQYFSFTMATSEADKLIMQFNGGKVPAKK